MATFSLPRLRHLPALTAVTLLAGCSSVSYYGQLAQGQWQLLQAREPVEKIVADPTRDAGLRQHLARSQLARTFASEHLHLPDNKSYRLYADLGALMWCGMCSRRMSSRWSRSRTVFQSLGVWRIAVITALAGRVARRRCSGRRARMCI
ncbi:hypothetical protein IBA8401_26600 [Pseudomonas syringae]